MADVRKAYGHLGHSPRETLDTRRKYIAVVLLSALIVAFESVAIEAAINIAELSLLIVSAVPSIIGGTILMCIRPGRTVSFGKGLGRKGWAFMALLCAFVAGGVLMWFDAISRIGASKEAILGGGSSEVLFIVLLSAVFLSERLSKWEAVGSFLVLAGVFLVLANAGSLSFSVGLGEAEAILSSLLLAISVVMTTMLLKSKELTPLSGVELFLSGAILLVVGIATGLIEPPSMDGLLVLLGLGLIPSAGLLTYNAGLPKIGASLTSVLFALTGIMTVGAQLLVLLFFPGADIKLPQNIALALLGGAVAFAGVYLLNRPSHADNAGEER
jgi:drug/metabolite transporter (DMT)-like permease